MSLGWQHQHTVLLNLGRRLFRIIYQFVYVLHLGRIIIIVFFHLCVHQQLLTQAFAFLLCELLKWMEIGIVILHDGLVHQHILNFRR